MLPVTFSPGWYEGRSVATSTFSRFWSLATSRSATPILKRGRLRSPGPLRPVTMATEANTLGACA